MYHSQRNGLLTDRQTIILGSNYSWVLWCSVLGDHSVWWEMFLFLFCFFKLKLFSSISIYERLLEIVCGGVKATTTLPVDKCPQCYHHCRQQCCHCYWFNQKLSMCPHLRKLCAPCWSLSVADCVHKSKATLDQYVNGDDRLVNEKCPRCLAPSTHVRHSTLCILFTSVFGHFWATGSGRPIIQKL